MSVGEAIFPSGRRKFCWVKYESALRNGFEKYSLGRDQTFPLGRVSLDLLHEDVFKFISKFTCFGLAWFVNFSVTLIFTSNIRKVKPMTLIYFGLYPKITLIYNWYFFQWYRVGCLFKVCKNVSESYFLGACISHTVDLEGGVNSTNLLSVFLEIVNPLTFGDFKPFAPNSVVERGSEDPLLTHEPFAVRSSNLVGCYSCPSRSPKRCNW